MPRKNARNVRVERRPDGRVYHYHRPTKTRLPGVPGEPEFERELARLNAGLPARADGSNRDLRVDLLLAPLAPQTVSTLGDLLRAYKASERFANRARSTKDDYLDAMDYLEPLDGLPLVQVDAPFLMRLRDMAHRNRGRWFANHLKRFLSMLWGWGAPYGYTSETNPAKGLPSIERPRDTPLANRPWAMDEFFAMLDAAPPNLRVAMALGGFAGLREGDICAATFAWWDGRLIEARALKTRQPIHVPAHLELRAILGAEMERRGLRPGDSVAMVLSSRSADGRFTESGLRAVFKTLRDRLLATRQIRPGLTIHGLRHTASVMLADAGCDTRDIMAVTGHRTESMVRLYTEGSDRRRRAEAAIAKLERYLSQRSMLADRSVELPTKGQES